MFSAPSFPEDLCKGQLLSLNVMKKNEANMVTRSNFSFLEKAGSTSNRYLSWMLREGKGILVRGAAAEWEIWHDYKKWAYDLKQMKVCQSDEMSDSAKLNGLVYHCNYVALQW